ncbi:MAG: hypothetical protein A2X94_14845 [Bdellovibrionales bacterium GWB1_55_8]|nr:MAG: hypothetical protein A2X94_14845 [Bdellovibrionales bacterium GWB1_55_8]
MEKTTSNFRNGPSRSKGLPQKPLQFQPLNDGLGFHPFSEGLPYTPVTKPNNGRPLAQGTGAVSAGQPTFAPIPRLASATPKMAPQAIKTAQAAPSPQIPSVAEELARSHANSNDFSYLLRRIWAFVFDTSLNFMIIGAGIFAALWKQGVPADAFLNSGVLLVAGAFAAFFSWALITSQEIAFGASIGKRLFGLNISASASKILIRAMLFVPLSILGGVGLLVAIFHPRRSCLHDIMAGAEPTDHWK